MRVTRNSCSSVSYEDSKSFSVTRLQYYRFSLTETLFLRTTYNYFIKRNEHVQSELRPAYRNMRMSICDLKRGIGG